MLLFFQDTDIQFIPFLKPCMEYLEEEFAILLNKTSVIRQHKPSDCHSCSKALQWIALCHTSDIRLQKLADITSSTYVCTKHFVDTHGPTSSSPNPLPANLTEK